jgi:hypothetical protein
MVRDTLIERFRIMAFRAPLLGYNTNVRHKGKLYHIQTEDSGIDHPHIITHLFADGGRIVASKKTSYAERVGNEGLQDTVKKLMQAQHKAMFIALRDGVYDEEAPESDGSNEETGTHKAPPKARTEGAPAQPEPADLRSPAEPSASTVKPSEERASQPEPPDELAKTAESAPKAPERTAARSSLFGGDLLSDKSLDEVILNYLAASEKES